MHDRLHLALGADVAGVEELSLDGMGSADHEHDALGGDGDLVEGARGGAQEPRAQEEVLGRVAGDRELREESQVGPGLFQLLEPAEDQVAVPLQVADHRIDLCEPDPHKVKASSLRL